MNYLIKGLGGALAGRRQAEGGRQHQQVAPRPGERHQLARRGVQVHTLQELKVDKAAQGKFLYSCPSDTGAGNSTSHGFGEIA